MSKKTKILKLSLYVLAFLCCSLAIIMLLIPFSVSLEETIYAVPPGKYRTEVTSDSSYYSKNFFDYIDYLKFQSWSPTEETSFVVFLIVSLVVSIVLVVVEALLFMRKITLSNKVFKITLLSLPIFSLVSFILAILLQTDASTCKICGYENIYLSGYPGWNFYEETSVCGSVILVPTIIFMFIAFSSQCVAGVLKFILKTSKQDEECSCSTFDENENTNLLNEKTGEYPPEELIKYKELLDTGIITQEEFDSKKKQLLGL